MTNADAHTTMVNAQLFVLYAVAVARRTTRSNSVQALGGGTVYQDVHPSQEGHRNRGKEDTPATSSTKARDVEEEVVSSTRTPFPRSQVLDEDVEGHTR